MPKKLFCLGHGNPLAPCPRVILLVASATLYLPTWCPADDWDNSSGDAQWSNSINWSDNTEPTSGESAIFPAGFPNADTTIKLGTGEAAFLLGFGDNYALANLVSSFDTATLTLASGVVNASAGKSAHIHVRLNNSNGLTKNGAGSVSLYRTNVIDGTIVIDAGTLGIRGSTTSCNQGLIANAGGSTGIVTVDGFNARWSISGTLFAGGLVFGDGAGTLNITGGGRVDDIYTALGGAAGSSATINVSGANSVWTTIDDLGMTGSAGFTCVVNITGGTVTAHGVHGGPGVTTLILDGGTLDTQGSSIGGITSGQYQITNLHFRSGTLRNVSQINNGTGLNKTTPGTLILEGANTYTGTTTVSEGMLKLAGDGSFASSPTISLAGSTTLDVTSVSSGLNFNGTSFALAAGQTMVGSGTVSGSVGIGAGSSVTITPSQNITFSNDTSIESGTVTVAGGSLTAPKIIDNGAFNITSGSVNASVLCAGNNGTLSGGAGTGNISLSGGAVITGAVLLGSSTGGSGNMTVSDVGDLTTNKIAGNDFIVDGGTVTVLDQIGDPPDPVLDRSMVAGYVHDGALIVNGGTVITPRIKLGVTVGKTGTYTQTGGMLDVDVLAIGNTADEFSNTGVGIANISGGTLTANTVYVGNPGVGAGTFRWSGGTLNVKTLDMAGDATLAVGLAGATIGSGYSQLQTQFNANLTGTLEISLADGFYPVINQTFVIMTFGSRIGTFADVTGTGAGPGKLFQVQYNTTNVTLVVVPVVLGDMNCDEAFDEFDADPFALALVDPNTYQQLFADCDRLIGDMNQDLVLDGRDIGLFVDCLINGGCQ